ncbi:hypothetical protein SAY86_011264 [Trapa natans]|uniref:Elongator complex protein 4 n=1 Tax=Trapa natans TaxID=22666 RepID=A0AAN7LYJ1_TRANT|nr:hypothetical protein SAY86_011264 [Trapa natans]
MLSFIKTLRSMLRSTNAVAAVTFPPSVLSPSFTKRWQHTADALLSVRAIQDEDKDLEKLLTGYQDMVGLLSIHKVARKNTQVPVILEASTFSMKLQKRIDQLSFLEKIFLCNGSVVVSHVLSSTFSLSKD